MVIKLLRLSDKYLQKDLNDKCMNFFKHNLNPENVYQVLDFAFEDNIPSLVDWCLKFFESNINVSNVSDLIQYLDKKPDTEFETEHLKLKKQAFDIVLENYISISQKQQENLRFYEDFLIRNVEMDTITRLANFISGERYKELMPQETHWNGETEAKGVFEQITINLQGHVFGFAHQNFKIIREKHMIPAIEKDFFVDLVSYEINRQENFETICGSDKINLEDEKKKGLKRREPSSNNDNIPEENPLLKQTKKDLAENQ